MVSMDRQPVSPKTLQVRCPLRDSQVPMERCLACHRLIDTDTETPPRYIVCDARVITGWLGLDE